MRRLCRQITRPSQDLKRGSWFWPKTLIKGKIRQVLGDRILAFIYNLVQNLKHQIPVLKILSVNLLMLSEAGRQDDLSAFLTSNGQLPSSPNLQKDEPQDDELDRRDEESDPDREVEKPRKGLFMHVSAVISNVNVTARVSREEAFRVRSKRWKTSLAERVSNFRTIQ